MSGTVNEALCELGKAKICISQESMRTLDNMRLNNLMCDARIRLKQDDTIFNVHRSILCSCSSFFLALFTNNTKSTIDNVVTVDGISAMAMNGLIEFAYRRKCDLTDQNVHEMYVIADYVGMLGLMRQCVCYMIEMLNPQTCVPLMLFARNRICTELEMAARSFIIRNFNEVAAKSQQLIQLPIDEFYDLINDDHLNVKDEQIVWNCCVKWIDYDATNRAAYVTRLMRGVRLGLLDSKYFNENVKDHQYVMASKSASPIIYEALTFLYDLISPLDENSGQIAETPKLALPRIPHDIIIAIGGWCDGLPQKFMESYDTRADRWVRIHEEDPHGPRAYHGTAVIGHHIYCIGGFDGMDYFNTCCVFNAITKLWKEVAPMHFKRCYVSVAAMNGIVYALGGYDGTVRQNSGEKYEPKTNQWSMIAPMNMQRSDACACMLDGKVYITGGFNGQECMNSAEFYDPETNVWTRLPNMTARRSGVSCIAHKGFLFVLGGFDGLQRMNSGERYDPHAKLWHPICEMYSPRSNYGIEVLDDMIYAIGGFNGAVTISNTECYSFEENQWFEATEMSIKRSALTTNVIRGLPNVTDYIHVNRHLLLEDRRQRLAQSEPHLPVVHEEGG